MKNFRLSRRTILVITVLFILAAGGAYSYWNAKQDNFNENTNKDGGAKQTTTQDGVKLKEDGTPIDSTIPKNEENSANKQTVGVTITSASRNGDFIILRTIVDKPGGNCRAIFSKDGQPNIEQSGSVVFVPPSYYACQGIDAPVSKFPASGEWAVVVKVESNSLSGSSNIVKFGIN